MPERLSRFGGPLLPWKVAGLLLALLALTTGWRTSWSPWESKKVWTVDGAVSLSLPHPQPDQPTALFIGNSRLMWPVLDPDSRARLMAAAGLGDHLAGLVGGPDLRIADLGARRERLHAYHPDIVIVQLDCFFPVGPARPSPDPAGRLADFVWNDQALYTSIDLVERLSPARRIAVEVPWPQEVVSKLPPGFWSRRAAARAALQGRGYTVIADDTPWPDDIYYDGIHLDPIGQARFRTWLVERLADILGPGPEVSVTAVAH